MPLFKSAQFSPMPPDENQLFVIMPADEADEDEKLSVSDDDLEDSPFGELSVSDEDDDGNTEPFSIEGMPAHAELSFALSRLPGAQDHELTVSDDDDEDEKRDGEEKKDDKPKDWQDMPKGEFLSWFRSYLDKIPKHKGETIALERAQSYLKKCLDILSKSVQQDFDGEIDIAKADDARSEIENGMTRLEKELLKRRKKAFDESSLMKKEGQKAMGVNSGGVMVTVPILISSIARACVNAVATQNRSLDDTFWRLSKKYALTDREKMETIQLLKDMNMPIQRDINMLDDEEYGFSSENNMSYAPNYWT